jgi:hypothetical protein
MTLKLKNDKFRNQRGGHSRILRIACQECNLSVCHYQKDGAGGLRRMYLDRIPKSEVTLTKKDLRCPKGHLLGIKMIYEKEKRPAFRLFAESVTKKIVKSN